MYKLLPCLLLVGCGVANEYPIKANWLMENNPNVVSVRDVMTTSQLRAIKAIGFTDAEIDAVKLHTNSNIPDKMKITSEPVHGVTFGDDIYIKHSIGFTVNERACPYPSESVYYLIVHEMAHTKQYRELGGIVGFEAEYTYQMIRYGYANAPLEKSARSAGYAAKGLRFDWHQDFMEFYCE